MGVLLNSLLVIVPLHYKYKVSADQTYISTNSYPLFDGVEATNYGLTNGGSAGFILDYAVSGQFAALVHGYSGVVTGTGQKFYIKKGSIATSSWNLTAGIEQRGSVAEWGMDTSAEYFYLNVAGVGRYDTVVYYSGVGNTHTIVCSGTTDNNMTGVLFGEKRELRMYDKDYSVSISWDSPGVDLDGRDGYYYLAKRRKWTKKLSYKWTQLTATQYAEFENFFDSFGGNLSQPFGMCILHDDTAGGFTPVMCILDGNSINIEYTGDSVYDYWNVSFSVYELDESMSTQVYIV